MNTLLRPPQASASDPVTVDLVCHPATPCSARLCVRAKLSLKQVATGWMLQLAYEVTGEVHLLRLPQIAESAPADGLWAHTCFEAFFSELGRSAYRELNFSPSTQWAHYRFAAERVRDEASTDLAAPWVSKPSIGSDHLLLTASIAATHLPQAPSTLCCAPTTVLQLTDGSLSYWAAHHPAPKPDFHARAGWCVPQRWAIP